MPTYQSLDFYLVDSADPTKTWWFDLSNIPTVVGLNNRWTVPGYAAWLVGASTEGGDQQILQSHTAGVVPTWEEPNFRDSQWRVNKASDSSARMAFSCSGVTSNKTRTLDVLDAPGANLIVGSGADPPAAEAIGKVNRTAVVAAIAATKLTDTTPAGYYVVDYTIETTTADVTAGTIQFGIAYADDVGATTQAGALLALTATGRDRGSFQAWLASGNITYNTALVGIFGTSAYALRVRCTFLG